MNGQKSPPSTARSLSRALFEVRRHPAPKIPADGAAISTPGYDAQGWWTATVPGTVLTTMIDRGIYPDSDYGLNNLAIPESLNRQDYWYRAEFPAPAQLGLDPLNVPG